MCGKLTNEDLTKKWKVAKLTGYPPNAKEFILERKNDMDKKVRLMPQHPKRVNVNKPIKNTKGIDHLKNHNCCKL